MRGSNPGPTVLGNIYIYIWICIYRFVKRFHLMTSSCSSKFPSMLIWRFICEPAFTDIDYTFKIIREVILDICCSAGPHDDVIKLKHFPRYWPFVRGIHPVTGEFPAQRPVTWNFDVFFDPRLNKRLSKQSWCWWFETPSRPLWRHCNDVKGRGGL